MAKEKTKTEEKGKKEEKADEKKIEETKKEEKKIDGTEENKGKLKPEETVGVLGKETKPEKKEVKKQEIKPKEKAVVNGISLRISPKYSFAICKMIRRKNPDKAIEILEKVILKKVAVPMNNREVGHRKGRGMMAGRYPINAAKEFIELLKQLKANAVVNSVENPVITIIKANKASRPYKREGRRGKRTHVYIEARDKTKLNFNKNKKPKVNQEKKK